MSKRKVEDGVDDETLGEKVPKVEEVDDVPVDDFRNETASPALSSHSGTGLISNIQWKPGDLVWGHVSSYPWWPGFIACDFDDQSTFQKMAVQGKNVRVYHVIFFGPYPEHNWVVASKVHKYEGLTAYNAYCDQLSTTSGGKKILKTMIVKARLQTAWQDSVKEADEAATMSVEDRIEKFTERHFQKAEQKYHIALAKKTQTIGRKSAPAVSSTAVNDENAVPSDEVKVEKVPVKKSRPSAPAKTEVDSDSDSEFLGAISQDDSQVVDSVGDFRGFCVKHKAQVQKSFPHFDLAQVKTFLDKVWRVLEPGDRKIYTSANSPSLNLTFSCQATASNRGNEESLASLGRPQNSLLAEYQLEVYRLTNTYSLINDYPCRECNFLIPGSKESSLENGSMIACSATKCFAVYHAKCAPKAKQRHGTNDDVVDGVAENNDNVTELSSEERKTWLCPDCRPTSTKLCFACDSSEPASHACGQATCDRWYHKTCAKASKLVKFDSSKDAITSCSHHICWSCAADNPKNPDACKGRFFRCVRCPKAYHVGDFCVPAGSLVLGATAIVCSDHFVAKKGHSAHNRVNVSWCFECNQAGTLICCEECPAAFHAKCLEARNTSFSKDPKDKFACPDCRDHKRPQYGDLVWVKVGHFRWWPCEVYHVDNVPDNIKKIKHTIGEFCVRFFGTGEFAWLHRGRVFHYQEGDTGNANCASKHLRRVFNQAVVEAAAAYAEWRSFKTAQIEDQAANKDRKPEAFKYIKSNFPIGNVQILTKPLNEIAKCDCDPTSEKPCSNDETCMNRMMLYECNPAVCSAGDHCHNQRFVKRDYPAYEPFRTLERGWGLRALEAIPQGRFIGEYIGELIDQDEMSDRMAKAQKEGITNFYFLSLDGTRIIDASPRSNLCRFINHSCDPNCQTQKWLVNGDVRIGIFALKAIPKGCEITFNYNLDALGTTGEKMPCRCGSINCSGLIGVKPKTQHAMTQETPSSNGKESNGSSTPKAPPTPAPIHDDFCFRCGDGGELLMCDKKNCTKTYHLTCLGLTKTPKGGWYCPRHHCAPCGKNAFTMCSICPNSYCSKHEDDGIRKYKNNQLYCNEHSDADIEDWLVKVEQLKKNRPARC